MINPGKPFNIHEYVEIFRRRIWFILIPLLVSLTAAGLYAYFAPREYMATTLILVTPQKIPEEYVKATVTSRIEDRLQSIAQEITSRTRLEQIITEFHLYAEEARTDNQEKIVEKVKKDIKVEIKGKEGYFTISFVGKDARVVTQVTNKLASLFIEENLRYREQQAQGTSEFLAVELQTMRTKLEEQEKAITQFKKQHMGDLPEQREANLRVLDQLQLNYQRIGDGLKGAQDRKWLIQKQLSDFEMFMNAVPSPEIPPEAGPPVSLPKAPEVNPYEVQLSQLKNSLMELQSKYTARHPDIAITKRKIADLETKSEEFAARQRENRNSEAGKAESTVSSKTHAPRKGQGQAKMSIQLNPQYKDIENQLLATDMEIARLKEEEKKLEAQIAKYRQRIEDTPAREQAMNLLLRDYQNTNEAYQTLLRKSQGAHQAESLERRQKGEQFRVIDPARVPETPYRPEIPKVLLLGLLAGLGVGLVAAFLREQMDRSFRDAEDLETTFGFKVLANLPRIEEKT